MKRNISIITIFISLFVGMPVFANSSTDIFSGCLVDTLNGKERKSLAKWVFFSISAHPELKIYVKTSKDDIEKSNKYVGKLITRMLTVDCPSELKAAIKSDPQAIRKAFELVGKVAMQELMTNKDVMQTISNYNQYIDRAKVNTVLSGGK